LSKNVSHVHSQQRKLYLVRFVAKEMNFVKSFISNTPQSVGLVPAMREDIERDLATDGKGQVIIAKLFLENLDEISPPPMLLERSQ